MRIGPSSDSDSESLAWACLATGLDFLVGAGPLDGVGLDAGSLRFVPRVLTPAAEAVIRDAAEGAELELELELELDELFVVILPFFSAFFSLLAEEKKAVIWPFFSAFFSLLAEEAAAAASSACFFTALSSAISTRLASAT